MNHFLNRIKLEVRAIRLRWLLAQILMAPLPLFFGGTLRAGILRMLGFQIAPGVTFFGPPILAGHARLHQNLVVKEGCWISIQVYFDLADRVILEECVSVGPQVMFITGTHKIGPESRRVGELVPGPIHVGHGAWLGARCTILPGVSIGEGAVVAAGAVVTKDIPPNTIAAGMPAVVKREIQSD